MKLRSQPTDTTAARAGRPGTLARPLASTLTGVWLACAPLLVGAEVYRWVDETGTTVYSQVRPPAGTTPAATIKPDAAPRAAEAQRATEQLRGQVEQDFDKRDQQARDSEAAGKKAAEQAARQANCEAARKNLETLKNHGGGRLRTPDGKVQYLSKDELTNREEQARKQMTDNCK